MVQNLIPEKTKKNLDYHPLLYFHAARAILMPQLEIENDPVFNEYAHLMIEYSRVQTKTQQELIDYEIENFSNKVIAFIR